jgi:CRP-like cAMP-binding protein
LVSKHFLRLDDCAELWCNSGSNRRKSLDVKSFSESSDSELISSLPHFQDLEPEAQQYIAGNWHRVVGKRDGSKIIDFDDPPDRGVIVVSGVVEMVSKSRGAIWHFGAGSVVDDCLITGTPLPYALVARTSCNLIVLGEWYGSMARRFPAVQSNLSRQAQLRRDAIANLNETLLRATKPGRVALNLLNIAQAIERPRIVEDDAGSLPFTVRWWETQDQISDLVYACRSKVRQALETLRRAGAVDFSGSDPQQLTMPLVLRQGCIDKLYKVLKTI